MTPSIRVRVLPGRLLGGLAVVAGGALAVAGAVFAPLPWLPARLAVAVDLAYVALGALVVVGGAGLIFGAFEEGCSACGAPLASVLARFPLELHEKVAARVRERRPLALLDLDDAPAPDPAAEAVSAIEVELCPCCRRCGRLAALKLRWDARRGQHVPYDRGDTVETSVWTLEHVARLAEARGGRLR